MIRSFVFSEGKMVAQDLDLDALKLVRADKGLIVWVDLDNPTPEEVTDVLESAFHFHPLAIEDAIALSELPKIEDYEDYVFLVMHAVDFNREDKFHTTELNFFIGRDFLVTHHQQSLHTVSMVMDRFIHRTGILPKGPDRIAHMLLDMLIDNYKPVLDDLHGEMEEMEENLLLSDVRDKDFMSQLISFRKDLSHLRQIIRPQREVILRLARGESRLIRATLLPYFRDIYDHLNRIEQTANNYHEQLLVSFDVFINKTANQTNASIRVLTAITALTLPPTVIGTWYGMNFTNMPELQSPHAYGIVSAITLACMAGTWFWLKRLKML
jgi:magnesium transporter